MIPTPMPTFRPGPLLARAAVLLTGAAAVTAALPDGTAGPIAWGVAALLASPSAVRPGSWWAAGLELTAVLVWILRTTAFGEPVTTLPLCLLAAALYLHHVACALTAAIPFDAAVTPRVWLGPLLRAGVVLALTAAVAAGVLGVADRIGPVEGVVAPVLGVAAAVALTAFLVLPLLPTSPARRLLERRSGTSRR